MQKLTTFLRSSFIIALFSLSLLLTHQANAMTDMDGKTVNIDTLVGKGKWTVFKIWAADCHVCHKTMHYLTDFEVSYPDADVYGISIDGAQGKADARRFIADHNLDFPNLLSDAVEIDKYLYTKAGDSLVGTPTLMVYNRQGQLLAVQPGPVRPEDLIKFIEKEEQ